MHVSNFNIKQILISATTKVETQGLTNCITAYVKYCTHSRTHTLSARYVSKARSANSC